jgi:transcriptional regulator with XRE-family HTH domain
MSPVKKLRDSLLLTQMEFAEMLGVSRPIISSYECGHSIPRSKMIRKMIAFALANGVNLNANDFFKENKELSTDLVDKGVS